MNSLLSLPGFEYKIVSQDWHPENHVSFARNHSPPNNIPGVSTISVANSELSGQNRRSVEMRLWPPHCIQGQPGAEIVQGLSVDEVDLFVQKGTAEDTEMLSIFTDIRGNTDCYPRAVSHDAVQCLRSKGITHLFIVGLAGDYCVRQTALDAANSGFTTCVVQEGTRCVDPVNGWSDALSEFEEAGVKVVSHEGGEVARVKAIGSKSQIAEARADRTTFEH